MPRPIIIGFDGSEHASDALALGRALATTLSTRLVVIIAYTPDQWLWAPGTADPMDRHERELVVAKAEAAFSGQDRVELRTVPSPSAAGALHAEAERERAQIIVVGSSHRGTIGRMLLGTVTQEVLDAAPCAVAVAPPGLAAGREIRFSRIGVGFDDTPAAHEALAVAHSFARCASAELRLLWAAHLTQRALPLAATSHMNPNYFEEVQAEVENRLEQAAAPIRDDVCVGADIVSGQTTDALVEQSERLDLLVLGSRGYGPLKRLLLGSVSRRVISDARCSVLVVPRGVRDLGDVAQPAYRDATHNIPGDDPMANHREHEPSSASASRNWSFPKQLRRTATDFRTRFARRRSRGEMSNTEREIFRADTPADVTSVRAKSSRHGKSTADKWNQ
jgi:nucleotide-binding universal stress UspA family protein